MTKLVYNTHLPGKKIDGRNILNFLYFPVKNRGREFLYRRLDYPGRIFFTRWYRITR